MIKYPTVLEKLARDSLHTFHLCKSNESDKFVDITLSRYKTRRWKKRMRRDAVLISRIPSGDPTWQFWLAQK